MSDLEFMLDCIDCNFSYALYVTMAKAEGRAIVASEETYNGNAR